MMAMVATTLVYTSASSQRHNTLPMARRTVAVLPRRCWAASEEGCAPLVFEQFEGGVEDLARIGVTLALHLLHPLVPDRLAREFGPARKLVGRDHITVELVVSGFGSLDHALLRGIEEIPGPEFCSRQTADAHDRAAHVLGQRLPLLLIGAQREIRHVERGDGVVPRHLVEPERLHRLPRTGGAVDQPLIH